MFNKILIANRGEIACRVIETCKRLGVKTVAIYSDIDRRSLHVRQADEAVYLGEAPSEASYLAVDKILAAARETGAEAIHPGYGFLSENGDFAHKTAEAGLAFIGPGPEVIRNLGDKITSKEVALKAGVPVVPGHAEPIKGLDEAREIAEQVGYPVLLKPAAGGGGRGMRIVHGPDELETGLREGQEETRKAFGDDRLFVERFIVQPRHIEIQIIADTFGEVLYLGERECSIQRRYQKVIEEAPSMALSQEQRQRMGEMACSLAREAGYANAGTVEFILDQSGDFFFLEMNTRLQVEHPVTENITGLDLVELQLKVASGQPLGLKQDDINLTGWSMEARICAEDTQRNFLPSTGLITRYAAPRGRMIRVDSGVAAGSSVSVYYDSMLAKVISYGADREEARLALVQALNRYHVEGVHTNIDFANSILNHPHFIKGEMTTAFIDEQYDNGRCLVEPDKESLDLMVIASTIVYHNRQNLIKKSLIPMAAKMGKTHLQEEEDLYRYVVKAEEMVFQVEVIDLPGEHHWLLRVDKQEYQVVTPVFEFYRRRIRLQVNGEDHYFRQQYAGNFLRTAFRGINHTFEIYRPKEWQVAHYMPVLESQGNDNALLSPMPGLVVAIDAAKGERVFKGQDLLIIESMKMESGVSSPCDGVIADIHVKVGQAVETDELMVSFEP